MEYLEFLKSKIEIASESGFEVDRDRLNKALKPHQQGAVRILWTGEDCAGA